MTSHLLISTGIFAALAVRSAWKLDRRRNPDDLVALVLWTAMMVWGVILI